MDALDKLKTDWKKAAVNYPKFTEQEIYAMLHKRSSSIVKWILIISIIEFVFWMGLSFLLKDTPQNQKVKNFHAGYILKPLEVAYYLMIVVFVYIFYKNYIKIKVTESARHLMQSILKTKRAVTNYIISMLIFNFISIVVIFILYFMYDPITIKTVTIYEENGNIGWFYFIYICVAMIGTAILLGGFWLIYRFIYGRMLKRLNMNYNELKKLDF